MRVVGFRYLENDLTATRPGTRKTDQNGETCAIIKIITREHGFTYDLGSLGHVAVDETHPGEIWLYVPHGVTHLTMNHAKIGHLSKYIFPQSVDKGRTYELLLDIGTGRYVTFTASRAGADIEIDGQYVDKAPIYNYYMHFGRHTVKAVNGRFEGTAEFFVSSNDGKEEGQRVVSVDMQDMSHLYGSVTVTVEGNADIYYAGRLVGTGRWEDQLKEGTHEVETRKADCDPVKTQFTVKAQWQNEIAVKPPTPHIGWLNVYTRPRNAVATYNGNHFIDLSETVTLPVGTYQFEFTRRGYVPLKRELQVHHNQTTRDTVSLERKKYVKPLAFYFGGGYTIRSMSGATGILGAVIHGHDLQASYTFGLAESDPVYWYADDGSYDYRSGCTYRKSSMALHYGYQVNLSEKLAITPQLGVSIDRLSVADNDAQQSYADGASATCLTAGMKLLYVPFEHCYLFAAPEYDLPLKKDANYTKMSSAAHLPAGGFVAHVGVLVNF